MNLYCEDLTINNELHNFEEYGVSLSKTQTASGSSTTITFDNSPDWGDSDMHDTSNNRLKFVRAGIYILTCAFKHDATGSSSNACYYSIQQKDSGGTTITYNVNWHRNATEDMGGQDTVIIDASVDDYAIALIYENGSGVTNITCNMVAIRIGD
jgi:hypothetical protein